MRVVKLLKITKYMPLIFKTIATLQFTSTESRIIIILGASFFAVHIFASIFFLQARMHEFSDDTWVI